MIHIYASISTTFRIVSLLCCCLWIGQQPCHAIDPDEIDGLKEALIEKQAELSAIEVQNIKAHHVEAMLDFGLLNRVNSYLTANKNKMTPLLEARFSIKMHQYKRAEAALNRFAPSTPEMEREKILTQIQLDIQAWELAQAKERCKALLKKNTKDIAAGFYLGRISIYEKQYNEAARWGKKLQQWDKESELGYGLEAEAALWNREIGLAEVLLKQALIRNPYQPNFRFWYGYTIWRKGEASLLDAMAAQWDFVLSIDPLNYLTHWHWGNGHTHLTYADYIHKADQAASDALVAATKLLENGKTEAALEKAKAIQEEYHESTFPAMFRASCLYNLAEAKPGALEEALTIFTELLEMRSHYGPAHNGIAAVIKKKQFQYLTKYDSLEGAIDEVVIPEKWKSLFYEVFPSLTAYPTDRVPKMVWNQLYMGKAYLPMLKELDREFVIPALHTDLATAMKNPWFRSASTFDNRQWMDIRGVGSGATGIEYVERGAHLERNVTLHEYVHLFHYTVFTDTESRKLRQLYFNAMKEDRTLDYYAANNESEYFAQCYTAFFSVQKVHPLNHKSMNTRQDLQEKDPEMFTFLKELTEKQARFLAGDEKALASNWAQTYVLLAEQQARGLNRRKMTEEDLYLKALSYDENYLPAQLGLIQVWLKYGQLERAEAKLAEMAQEYPNYAPIYQSQADLAYWKYQKSRHQKDAEASYITTAGTHLQRALETENDLQLQVNAYRRLREFYHSNGKLEQAIQVSTTYYNTAADISTYLRDAKQDALAYKSWLRGQMGYTEEIEVLKQLLIQYPQNYQFWLWYGDVLAANHQHRQVIELLLPEAKRLAKIGNPYANAFFIQVAESYLYEHQTEKAREIFPTSTEKLSADKQLQFARVATFLDQSKLAAATVKKMEAQSPFDNALMSFTEGKLQQHKNDLDGAMNLFLHCLSLNPHHLEARRSLVRLLMMTKQVNKARKIVKQAKELDYSLSESVMKELEGLVR